MNVKNKIITGIIIFLAIICVHASKSMAATKLFTLTNAPYSYDPADGTFKVNETDYKVEVTKDGVINIKEIKENLDEERIACSKKIWSFSSTNYNRLDETKSNKKLCDEFYNTNRSSDENNQKTFYDIICEISLYTTKQLQSFTNKNSGELTITKGTYLVNCSEKNGSIIINSNTQLDLNGSTIKQINNHNLTDDENIYSIFKIADCATNILIKNGTIKGDKAERLKVSGSAGNAISANSFINTTIKNLNISFISGDGINIIGKGDESYSNRVNLYIEENIIYRCNGNGITVKNGNSINITNNKMYTIEKYAINLNAEEDNYIEDVKIGKNEIKNKNAISVLQNVQQVNIGQYGEEKGNTIYGVINLTNPCGKTYLYNNEFNGLLYYLDIDGKNKKTKQMATSKLSIDLSTYIKYDVNNCIPSEIIIENNTFLYYRIYSYANDYLEINNNTFSETNSSILNSYIGIRSGSVYIHNNTISHSQIKNGVKYPFIKIDGKRKIDKLYVYSNTWVDSNKKIYNGIENIYKDFDFTTRSLEGDNGKKLTDFTEETNPEKYIDEYKTGDDAIENFEDVDKIYITSAPTTRIFVEGEDFNYNGLKVKIGSEEFGADNFTGTVKGYNRNKLGMQKIVVEYKGRKTSYLIEVISKDSDENNNSTVQKAAQKLKNAIKEIAYSYYMRGPYFQYNSSKALTGYISPEEATNQDMNYLVCSCFTKNIYYELFGPELGKNIPEYTTTLIPKGRNAIGKSPSVIAYATKNTVEKGVTMQFIDYDNNGNIQSKTVNKPKFEEILPYLRVGDIITYTGHTKMIYDLIYDDYGNVVDAYTMEVGHGSSEVIDQENGTSKKKQCYISTKIGVADPSNQSLFLNSYNRKANGYDEGIEDEGAVALSRLSKCSIYYNIDSIVGQDEYSILRFASIDENGNLQYNNGTKKSTSTDYTKATEARIAYSKLYIEKTLENIWNEDTVQEGDTIEYKITVTNKSGTAYDRELEVIEEIDTDLVTFTENTSNKNYIFTNDGANLTWNIGRLNAGESATITYKVTVNNGNIGKTIVSNNGKVGNEEDGYIPSGTVKNQINYRLSNADKELISNAYEKLINDADETATGLKFIDQIYQESGVYQNLFGSTDGFSFADNISLLDICSEEDAKSSRSLIIDANIKSKFVETKDAETKKLRKITFLNNDSDLYTMVLGNYWSRLCSLNTDTVKIGKAYNMIIKYFKSYSNLSRRADTIYKENFQTGDILIYENINDTQYILNNSKTEITDEQTITNENGFYAYIYIKGKGFVGKNLGDDVKEGTSDDRNDFNATYYTDNELKLYPNVSYGEESRIYMKYDEIKEFANYQTLFGKDTYVILRPAQFVEYGKLEKIKIEQEPTRTVYMLGDDFDTTGMVVKAVYDNELEREITNYTVVNGKNLQLNTNQITISYTVEYEDGTKITREAYQDIQVIWRNGNTETIKAIEITNPPTKQVYNQGEDFDTTGMVVKAIYYGKDSEEITDYTILDGEGLSPEQMYVTISYTVGGETKTVTQEITVLENLSKLVTANSEKENYIQIDNNYNQIYAKFDGVNNGEGSLGDLFSYLDLNFDIMSFEIYSKSNDEIYSSGADFDTDFESEFSDINLGEIGEIILYGTNEMVTYDVHQLGNLWHETEGEGEVININDVVMLRKAILGDKSILNNENFEIENTDVNFSNSERGTLGDIGDILSIRQRILSSEWCDIDCDDDEE